MMPVKKSIQYAGCKPLVTELHRQVSAIRNVLNYPTHCALGMYAYAHTYVAVYIDIA